ncbi:SUMF1/EgtB/PvdO family nonheme iron enzyme [Rhodoblastus acidophilus]|uniref:SUMF1/EgtB/PvdO family nonheme iron enzyme n=1 Tax=Rhodoblastus acidophilus TaxID=1074 RepID=A0A6N8DRL1_RHOAC|nr:SUMF1/EgtB/PvdO family nonheme iron enzyme [Rhodoblastus acidophilus]MCW2275296.1 formylglycine-generating enzyme required for sulfatase activity [Rhodoblastus acidophilus]MTV31811.1 SUMF1/EgtB/PvdO family nonheme iron enzyme [Rhodoblastus acidophilus]
MPITLEELADLLQDYGLRAGTNSIEPVALISDINLPKGVRLFRCVWTTPVRVHRELLFIWPHEHSPPELVDAIHTLYKIGPPGYDGICFALSEKHMSVQLPPSAAEAVSVIYGARDLLRLLVSPSHDLTNRILQQPRAEFNLIEFRRRYQPRQATVVSNAPGTVDSRPIGAPINLTDHLHRWANLRSLSKPIILLGERGSGKTWEIINFCVQQTTSHTADPLRNAIALYYPLQELRRSNDRTYEFRPSFPDLCLRQYGIGTPPGLKVLWDAKGVSALMNAGFIVTCLDGLDELIDDPGSEHTFQQIWQLISSLSAGSKFLITCRSAYFDSLHRMLSLPTWGGMSLKDRFDIIELMPFSASTVEDYVATVNNSEQIGASNLRELVSEIVRTDNTNIELIFEIIATLATRPAALSALEDIAESSGGRRMSVTSLLERLIYGVTIDFNLGTGRTRSAFIFEGKRFSIDRETRTRVLEELAAILADDRTDIFAPSRLAQSLTIRLGIATPESLQADMRAQTVLELVNQDCKLGVRLCQETEGLLKFGFSPEKSANLKFLASSPSLDGNAALCPGADRLFRESAIRSPVCVTSIAGAYFAAAWMARRLGDLETINRHSGTVDDKEWLTPLGRFPIGPVGGLILREKLVSLHGTKILKKIERIARQNTVRSARLEGFSVFTAPLRYLWHNLEAMRVITQAQREGLDPWTEEVAQIENVGLGLRMVLVDAPEQQFNEAKCGRFSPSSQSFLNREDCDEVIPFLMTTTEVTNDQFLEFLNSSGGVAWRPENITIAGGGRATVDDVSSKSQFTNEYHLYHWKHAPETDCNALCCEYKPPTEASQHPVTYVSWFAAAAYCDWLSARDHRTLEYSKSLGCSTGRNYIEQVCCGYRLPTASEWKWAAQAGRPEVEFPWELYPYYILPDVLNKYGDLDQNVPDELRLVLKDAIVQRENMKRLLVEQKQTTTPVGEGDFPTLGVLGLVGNVKEWCDDQLHFDGTAKPEHMILGASAALGERSFRFDYAMALFPENTNPDVGFRVARSLSAKEISSLKRRRDELRLYGRTRRARA